VGLALGVVLGVVLSKVHPSEFKLGKDKLNLDAVVALLSRETPIVLPPPIEDIATPTTPRASKREFYPPLSDFFKRRQMKGLSTSKNGVLMEAQKGEAVRTALDGTVVYDGKMRGMGQMIIIDHGHGIHTIYAHLGEVRTRIDEKLQRGQVVGYIGDNDFYFELRENGKAKAIGKFLRGF
jgi:murein DD-endopeptidase MepM/ murein hydrolase activator NlpD